MQDIANTAEQIKSGAIFLPAAVVLIMLAVLGIYMLYKLSGTSTGLRFLLLVLLAAVILTAFAAPEFLTGTGANILDRIKQAPGSGYR